MAKIVLGVTGSIAAYKACELVRLFVRAGDEVRVVMTRAACEFVTPLTFRTLSRNPVGIDEFASPADWRPEHVAFADWADLVVVAPATANVIAKMRAGLADDLLTGTLLATRAPILVAPAMNTGMWESPVTQENIAALRARGVRFVEPRDAELACGVTGVGCLAAPADIFAAVRAHLGSPSAPSAEGDDVKVNAMTKAIRRAGKPQRGRSPLLLCVMTILACATAFATGTRFVSYNIHHGRNWCGRVDLVRPARLVAGLNARFVALQEVDQRTRRVKGADTCAIFARECGLHATFAKAINYAGGRYGVALLSREKPLAVRRTMLPGREPRVLLLCEFADCWVGTMHLDVASSETRVKSVEIVRQAVAACGDKPVFLSGDWNARPDDPPIRAIKRFMTILSPQDKRTFTAFRGETGENGNSCIDYIAVNSAHAGRWRVTYRGVVTDMKLSDHQPVVVDLEPVRPLEASNDLGQNAVTDLVAAAGEVVNIAFSHKNTFPNESVKGFSPVREF